MSYRQDCPEPYLPYPMEEQRQARAERAILQRADALGGPEAVARMSDHLDRQRLDPDSLPWRPGDVGTIVGDAQ